MRTRIVRLLVSCVAASYSGECKLWAQSRSQPESKPAAAANKAAHSWIPLFNGRDLDGWYTFLQKHGKNSDPDRVITIEDGTIHLYKHAADASNVVMGYIGTTKEYGNYHLRLQYRWGPKKFEPRYKMKRDAGLYYHILGADAVWPHALQFQIEQTNVGDLIALYGLTVDTWIDPKTKSAEIPHVSEPRERGRAACSEAAGSPARDTWRVNSRSMGGTPSR